MTNTTNNNTTIESTNEEFAHRREGAESLIQHARNAVNNIVWEYHKICEQVLENHKLSHEAIVFLEREVKRTERDGNHYHKDLMSELKMKASFERGMPKND